MFSSFSLGWEKLDPVEWATSLKKYLNWDMVVVEESPFVRHIETKMVEVKLFSWQTGRSRW